MTRKELSKLDKEKLAIFVHMRNKLKLGNTLKRKGISIYKQNQIVETGLCDDIELNIINDVWESVQHPEGVE
jgi:hypothetical protein